MPYVKINIGGKSYAALVDTCAEICLIKKNIVLFLESMKWADARSMTKTRVRSRVVAPRSLCSTVCI